MTLSSPLHSNRASSTSRTSATPALRKSSFRSPPLICAFRRRSQSIWPSLIMTSEVTLLLRARWIPQTRWRFGAVNNRRPLQWPPHESEQSKLDNNVLLSKNKIYRDLRGGRKVRRPRSADARIVADLARGDKNLSSRSRSQNNQLG